MRLSKLTPNLMVSNVDRTIEFYQRVLGFELVQAVPDQAPFEWASMRAGEVELMFQSRPSLAAEIPALQDREPGGTLTFFIVMDGIQALYERVVGQVPVLQELHETFFGVLEFALADCNGYILTFAEPRAEGS